MGAKRGDPPPPNVLDLGNGEALVIGTAADFAAAAAWLKRHYPGGPQGDRCGPAQGPVVNMTVRWLSKPGVLWALYDAPDVPAHLLATLIVVAHTDQDGQGSYLSANSIAELTRKTESQAKRNLKELEKLKLIRRGNQRLVAHIRPDRRPVVYNLAMPRGSTDATSSRGSTDATSRAKGVAPTPERGSTEGQNGVAPALPEEFPKNSGKGEPPARVAGAGDGTPQDQTPPLAADREPVDVAAEIARTKAHLARLNGHRTVTP